MLRVSIIMNIRNGAANLREALDSVMAQTFADWELIVWDDRSSDDSAKVVAEYGDHRIHYFLSPEETPLGRARELAIRQAKGEWLAFLDQDDVWLPNKLQQQMALDVLPPSAVGGSTKKNPPIDRGAGGDARPPHDTCGRGAPTYRWRTRFFVFSALRSHVSRRTSKVSPAVLAQARRSRAYQRARCPNLPGGQRARALNGRTKRGGCSNSLCDCCELECTRSPPRLPALLARADAPAARCLGSHRGGQQFVRRQHRDDRSGIPHRGSAGQSGQFRVCQGKQPGLRHVPWQIHPPS